MGKTVRKYKCGDFVFAKRKGYPAWPARVKRPNGKKYLVFIYGTGETANVNPNLIWYYTENKKKMLSNPVNPHDFNKGVVQIEYDIVNNVSIDDVVRVPLKTPAKVRTIKVEPKPKETKKAHDPQERAKEEEEGELGAMVLRSGKILGPKRCRDVQEENATLPSPATKRHRDAPVGEKERAIAPKDTGKNRDSKGESKKSVNMFKIFKKSELDGPEPSFKPAARTRRLFAYDGPPPFSSMIFDNTLFD